MSAARLHPRPQTITHDVDASIIEAAAEALLYVSWPPWARSRADRWKMLFRITSGMRGAELKRFIAQWNIAHPECTTSYQSYQRKLVDYRERGIIALRPNYARFAKRINASSECAIREFWFEEFSKDLLSDGRFIGCGTQSIAENMIARILERKK